MAKAAVLVGTDGDIAGAIHEFANTGITNFRFREWPGRQEMKCFAARIAPLVRALDEARADLNLYANPVGLLASISGSGQ